MIFWVGSMLMYLIQNFSNKQFSRRVPTSSTGIALVQNGICVAVSTLCLLLLGGAKVMSAPLMVMAAAFGALYLSVVFLLLKSFAYGSMGGSTLLCNAGNFISTVYGIVKFGDAFTPLIAVGMVLLLAAVILCTPKANQASTSSVKWFALAIGSGLSNGILASLKREAVALCGGDVQTFLMWGFFFAALIAVIAIIVRAPHRTDAVSVFRRAPLLVCGVLAGIGTVGANFLQMKALEVVSSAVVYPLTAGFLVVSLWLASFLIYKEVKATWKNVLSIVCCVTAIVLMNLK